MKRLTLTAAVLLLLPAAPAAATTFYVSPSGSNSNPGTVSAPWRTVAKVDRFRLAPGDAVLFRGGSSFTDATLTPSTSGSATLFLSSSYTGRAPSRR